MKIYLRTRADFRMYNNNNNSEVNTPPQSTYRQHVVPEFFFS